MTGVQAKRNSTNWVDQGNLGRNLSNHELGKIECILHFIVS